MIIWSPRIIRSIRTMVRVRLGFSAEEDPEAAREAVASAGSEVACLAEEARLGAGKASLYAQLDYNVFMILFGRKDERVKKLRDRVDELERLVTRLKTDLIHDQLTGLKTRAFFEEECGFYLSVLSRGGRASRKEIFAVKDLAILFFDIDHFKSINDKYGHQAGDSAIRKVAAAIMEAFREKDVVARWGGEEFAALLPGASEDEAAKKAEEIREKISKLHFEFDERFSLTISIGAAAFSQGIDYSEFLKMADEALYRAKDSGRNMVVRYSALDSIKAKEQAYA